MQEKPNTLLRWYLPVRNPGVLSLEDVAFVGVMGCGGIRRAGLENLVASKHASSSVCTALVLQARPALEL